MGHQVTIEGSLTPAVDLPRGVRRTVEVTDHIRRLVQIGAVIVVGGDLDAPPAPEHEEPADIEEIADEPNDGSDDDGVPARNASRKQWAQFLRSKDIDFPDGDESKGELWAGRDDLIVIWQQASGGN